MTGAFPAATTRSPRRESDLARARALLHRHGIDAWFPRCLDREQGGFLCDFDRAWRPCGDHGKLLEFQARTTLFAAEALRARPDEPRLAEAVRHGFAWLSGPQWDEVHGGWFHRVSRHGAPLGAGVKHAHGAAYAIEACAGVFEATGDPAALSLAREGVRWLERAHRDRARGGWVGPATREGVPITDPALAPGNARLDGIGTPVGWKDGNVHSDLVETFLRLESVRPDPLAASCLAHAVEVTAERLADPETGGQFFFASAGLVGVPRSHRASNEVQTASRLLAASAHLGEPRLRDRAVRLVERAIEHGKDPRRPGLFLVSRTPPPDDVLVGSGQPRAWWVQVETLVASLGLHVDDPSDPRWPALFHETFDHLFDAYVDERRLGLFPEPRGARPLLRRPDSLAPPRSTRKSYAWKDGSHEARAALFLLSHLPRARFPEYGP
jgi:mannobiose 2-epimerase